MITTDIDTLLDEMMTANGNLEKCQSTPLLTNPHRGDDELVWDYIIPDCSLAQVLADTATAAVEDAYDQCDNHLPDVAKQACTEDSCWNHCDKKYHVQPPQQK